MPEPLTSSLLVEELGKLMIAFPRNATSRDPVPLADVYRNGLNGLTGDAVRAAVALVIREDEHFPKVARLRELATDYQKRTNAVIGHITGGDEADELRCRVCGAVAKPGEERKRRKVKITPRPGRAMDFYEYVLDEKGQPIWETVISDRLVMTHDARKHGIFSSEAA